MASAKLRFLNGAIFVALIFSLAADPDPRDAPEIDEIVVKGTRPSPVPRLGDGGTHAYTPNPWDGGGGSGDGFDPNRGDQLNVADAAKSPCDQRGNPVVLPTGNKIESMTDFASFGEMPLTLERTYNRRWTYRLKCARRRMDLRQRPSPPRGH
jgi:hypothetical protein